MPFLGLATTGDLKKVKSEGTKALHEYQNAYYDNMVNYNNKIEYIAKDLKDLNSKLLGHIEKSKSESCTMLVNGVYICDHAKYDETNTKDPEDLTMNDLLFKDTDFCVKFDHLPDITGMPLNEYMGHGDIPDNYICFEKGKIDQYVQSIMPAQRYNMMTQNESMMNQKLRDRFFGLMNRGPVTVLE